MLRIDKVKSLLAVALAAVVTFSVPASAAQDSFRPDNEELYFGALEEQQVEHISTVTAKRGDFVVNAACKGEINFENSFYMMNTVSNGSVRFLRYLVQLGDYVEKDDPICEIQVSADVSDMSSLEEKIELEENNLEEYLYANELLLEEYLDTAQNSPSESERKVGKLLYDRLSYNVGEETKQREKKIADMEASLEALQELSEIRYITASGSGVISNLNFFNKGATIKPYAYIGMIVDTDHIFIRVDGGSENLFYNSEVTVVQGQGSDMIELKGRVLTCKSTTLAPNLISNYDLIEVLDDTSELYVNKDVTIRTKSTYMENVIIADKAAVGHDSNGYYVFRLENGVSVKRYVVVGGSNPDCFWIIRGIDEGDELVIK